MTWRVNFERSKDAQKQLARTSLICQRFRDPLIPVGIFQPTSFAFAFYFHDQVTMAKEKENLQYGRFNRKISLHYRINHWKPCLQFLYLVILIFLGIIHLFANCLLTDQGPIDWADFLTKWGSF